MGEKVKRVSLKRLTEPHLGEGGIEHRVSINGVAVGVAVEIDGKFDFKGRKMKRSQLVAMLKKG